MKSLKKRSIAFLMAICVFAQMLLGQTFFNHMDVQAAATKVSVSYSVHCQGYGWMKPVSDGVKAGTSGESKRLESIQISVNTGGLGGGITYRTHVQENGWLNWVSNGKKSGTTGQSKRLEAIQIKLTGELAEKYDVVYRVHCQSYGWLGWVKNGAVSGTVGKGKRLEAIQIKLVEKSGSAEKYALVTYKAQVQDYGWLPDVSDGETAGTTGKGKRLETLSVKVDSNISGSVMYQGHVQNYGWMDWSSDGQNIGTVGESKRLEAVKIKLTGVLSEKYDIYYRTHIQNYGWLGWAKNGQASGSAGLSMRIEAIQIEIVEKGAATPGSTDGYYVDGKTEKTSWTITQYGDSNVLNSMFYTVTDNYGNLVIIDGGLEGNADKVREVIANYGNHVSAWIITHPHPDHAGAFNVIAANPKGITIDKVYTTDVNYDRYKATAQSYDGFETCTTFMQVIKKYNTIKAHAGDTYDILGLKMNVIHGWDSSVDALQDHLCNDGSLMFTLEGNENSMLFCGDVQKEMEETIMSKYMDTLKKVDYVQTGHHGNWGLSTAFYDCFNPKIAFFDSSNALLAENTSYDGYLLKRYFTGRGIKVCNFSTTPNTVVVY